MSTGARLVAVAICSEVPVLRAQRGWAPPDTWTRKRWPERPDDFFIKPKAIANEIWHVVHQERSAWSFNVELRPFGENW